MKLLIISGGQTGADRGGLDAAIEMQVDHDGWCPKGRLAEDGVIPPQYKLRETESREYKVRTKRNVDWANVTVIFTDGALNGGSKLTYDYCVSKAIPVVIVGLRNWDGKTIFEIASWLSGQLQHHAAANKFETFIINVAGSRASKSPHIQFDVKQIMVEVICKLLQGG